MVKLDALAVCGCWRRELMESILLRLQAPTPEHRQLQLGAWPLDPTPSRPADPPDPPVIKSPVVVIGFANPAGFAAHYRPSKLR